MSDIVEKVGNCLCGSVRIVASNIGKSIGACHCGMCRQWSGGPFLALDCGTDVTLEGEESIGIFASSQWAERGFCNKCGSHLFYRIKANRQYFVPVGLFREARGLVFDHQIFIDEKPPYYEFANETENMTGAEVFAKYAPPTA